MHKASNPQSPAASRGASNALRAASATKGALRTGAEQDSMQTDVPALIIDSAQRQAMIAEAAYYKALDRGFSAGCEMQDWLQAEQEIDLRLM